jgi:hypothetical protein
MRFSPKRSYLMNCNFSTVITAAFLVLFATTDITHARETTGTAGSADNGQWLSLMDGKTYNGWKASESRHNSWSIENGSFVARGNRSHLFYMGDKAPFKDFELKLDVKTTSGSNGGIFIHTAYQEENWPKHGYEIQVNQTHSDWRKSGSIYAVNDVREVHVPDDEWYSYHITVDGKRIIVKMNDKVVNDWTEEPDRKPGADFTRILTSGTIALQAHDPDSVVHYRNIKIKPSN